jgi:hypothetical protein
MSRDFSFQLLIRVVINDELLGSCLEFLLNLSGFTECQLNSFRFSQYLNQVQWFLHGVRASRFSHVFELDSFRIFQYFH